MKTAVLYVGFLRATEVEITPVDLGCGVGQIACLECEGSGEWGQYLPEPEPCPCVTCKGTGIILVNI